MKSLDFIILYDLNMKNSRMIIEKKGDGEFLFQTKFS